MYAGRRYETGDNADGAGECKDGLKASRHSPSTTDDGGDRYGGDGEKDVAEVNFVVGDAVVEAKAEEVAQQVARDNHHCGRVRPDNCRVGQAKEPGAEKAVVTAEGVGRVVVDASRPRMPIDHVVVVPGHDDHDQSADEEAEYRPDGARLGQEGRPRKRKGVPPHGTAEGERPRPEKRKMLF